MNNKTYATKAKDIERKWHLLDAKDVPIGRVATQAAQFLMGKDKINYAPYLDCGDYVVVINAGSVGITGNKLKKKLYRRHSGYPGNLRTYTLEQMMQKNPRKVIRHAVKGMLPKNKLGRKMITRLYVYPEEEHEHEEKLSGT